MSEGRWLVTGYEMSRGQNDGGYTKHDGMNQNRGFSFGGIPIPRVGTEMMKLIEGGMNQCSSTWNREIEMKVKETEYMSL